ncbi:MKI67 FHA domain-interacting nucleolar phosphoprotein-like [Cydia fagiglandana]|uniref:MKI67 FHA domain-interacting nucleolar phosphoprotein-like n=1 Tax=Cydia fagiglandana TaxID=1458189 RepID=UPI002FEDF7F4
MEENVALDSTKQRKFNKSIKGIKKLLKKNEDKPHKPAVLAPKDEESKTEKKKKRPDRGLVYLSHIPHGFYEHEMTQYFKQFGMVTKVRVIRSPRTGRSKGYAFVEFREPAVAEIVAETMNNYLMGKRLIKAAIIPPEKQKHKAVRKYWSTKHNPTAHRRIKERKAHNAEKTDAEHLKKAKKMLLNLQKTKKKLNDLGIDYDFFKPVDVPAALLENVKDKSESESKAVKTKNEADEKQNKKKKTNAAQTTEKVTKEKKPETKQKSAEGKSKKDIKKPQESDKAKQNEKQKKMKAAGVKLPENFIKIAEEAEESDSSLDFDSDEYEKMLGNDSDASSGDESDDNDEEDSDGEEESDDEESEEEIPQLIPIKQKKGKKPLVALPPPKQASKPASVPKAQKPQPPQPKKGPKPANVAQGKKAPPAQQAVKRKNQQPEVSPKKPKFEKKDKKPRNKQFKKKNKA